MPRLLSKASGNKLSNEPKPKEVPNKPEEELELLPSDYEKRKNGFYRLPSGDKVFVFNKECFRSSSNMPAWVYYNFATNFKSKKMNQNQYFRWRVKMEKEGKGRYLYN